MSFRVDPAVIHESAKRGDRWYPYAVQFPIPEADLQAHIVARLLILHSMAGPAMTSLESIRRYYARDDIHTESTFGLAMTGEMAQFVPIDVRADCNASANPFAGSVETQDRGYPTLPTTAWTADQVEQLGGLGAWMHLNPLCDLELVDPSAWNSTGVGYHSQFSKWSIYQGKTCPGAARIGQMPEVRARAVEIAAWTGLPIVIPKPEPPGGDLMITVFQPTDCLAEFIAMCDRNGNALEVEWINTAAAQARRDAHIAAGARIDRGGAVTPGAGQGRFRNCTLRGPIPHGDTYQWTASDFFRIVA